MVDPGAWPGAGRPCPAGRSCNRHRSCSTVFLMETVLDLLTAFIATQSVTGSEGAFLDAIQERFRQTADPRWKIARRPEGLVVRHAAHPADRPLVILAGHVDTVAPQGDPGPRREGELLYGLGASDMKSGLAVMTHLALNLDQDRLPLQLAWVYYAGEEGPFDGNGLGPLLEAHPELREAALAVLLEPTGNGVELGCLGTFNLTVEVPGRTCHSARPWMGRSALDEAAAWIGEMSRRQPRERVVSGLSFHETAAITTLQAGSARNVLPGRLTANVNLRYAPGRAPGEILEIFARSLSDRWSWSVADHAPAGAIDLDAPLMRRFLDAVDVPRRAKQGWTDVARFTTLGIPALNFGPGIPELAHRADEHVPIANLDRCADLLRAFLEAAKP
ncbi:MAG: succinyl-diaminopimelate desuccinylase [Candidatus Eisenbacteria bacterium]|nr:succinyl-diaminopimelate desuccinylase [Candidatus Eisenbacteria bacterium]